MLSQKETMLLNDLKNHEVLCIEKYTAYAGQAHDPQLKQLFSDLAGQEQQHLNTLNQIASGQVPNMAQQGQQQQQAKPNVPPGISPAIPNPNDAVMCNDLLMAEKYVSGTYNTAIFEFRDTNVRKTLNHIQKEEQEHGEQLFNYMQQKGMYKVQ
jgi:spore coat protein CotF